MAKFKLKYRPSSVSGREGTLFYQIIHQREVRQVHTGLRLFDYEWDARSSSVIMPPAADAPRSSYLSSLRSRLEECRVRLDAVVSRLDALGLPYTAREVVAAYMARSTVVGVISFTRRLIDDLRKAGKQSAASRLRVCLSSFLRFTAGREVDWADLTPLFMLGYEEFLRKRGLCRNSTSFYMRNLRALLNRAADEGYDVPRRPFRHVYTGVDKTRKRAVSLDVVRRIRDLDLNGRPALDFARNVFMFAFYTRGMSFVDIAHLRKSDVEGDTIIYSRSKTRRRLHVRIEPATRLTIDRFGKNESQYLLPILSDDGEAPETQYVNAYNRVNRNIKKIGEMLGLEAKLTLYAARHAWASIAYANNVPLSVISSAMGHDSETTTLIYLQSLDAASVDQANSDIINKL